MALDCEESQALALAKKAAPYVRGYKIGPRLFLPCGAPLIHRLKELGREVFLDLKFHDIPSATAAGVAAARRIGADYVTVHASCGDETLSRLAEQRDQSAETATASGAAGSSFEILFVTVLTGSLSAESPEAGPDSVPEAVPDSVSAAVLRLADSVVQKGFRGLVASPHEARLLRERHPDIFLVTPGVRLKGEAADDQKRIMTPKEAMEAGSSALVIGRSVIRAPLPALRLKEILDSL